MSNIKFTNFAATTLASGINSVVTSLTVATGTGALFPTLAGAEYFFCVLADAATGNTREVVKVTARSTDTFTITRAQDSTTGQTYATGDKVELRLTAAGIATLATTETAQTFTGVQTFAAPVLGTPTSATLTNATGLPISTGVSGLGTNVATALATNIGTAGAPVVNGGVLGTPSSGTVTNLTGTASININGTVGATTPSTGAFTSLSSTIGANFATSSGSVGIGTSSPGALLHVGTTTAKIRIGATAGSEYLDISRDSATGNMIYNAAQASFGTHNFQIAGTEAMRIDSAGNVTLQKNISVGAAAPTTSGTGITFPATDSASTNANTLDDYEEGTWAPLFTGLTVVGTPTYTGTYVKVGRMVVLNLKIASTTSTSSAGGGSTTFTGMPFTPNSSGGAVPFVNVSNTSLGNGLNTASSGTIYCPAWAAALEVYMSYTYQV